jgi:transcriptional regulator with XRE-family HTH domain
LVNIVKEKMNKLSSLGERIKKIREDMKLNQADFAKRIGLDTATGVSNYEKNKRKPDINTLIKIAELGGVNLDWLLIGETSKVFFKEPGFEIATLIRNVRQELGLNRAAFGKKFGVDPDFIAEVETAGKDIYNKEGETPLQAVAEPPSPEYKTEPPELTRLKAQMERIYKGRDKETIAKLQGFLAALDPGEDNGRR